MVRSILAGLLASTLLAAASAAQATTLFQSVADLTSQPDVNGFCSDCFSGGYKVLQPFSLGSAATADRVTVALTTDFFFPAPVTVEIFEGMPSEDPAMSLGAPIFSHGYAPADFLASLDTAFDTTLVTLDLGGVALNAWQTYSIGFFNADGLAVPGFAGGSLFQQNLGLGGGSFYPDTVGFRLEGEFTGPSTGVPEPAAWALMVAGFGLAGAALRRRAVIA